MSYQLLSEARDLSDLGQHFGAGLYALEINYLVAHEWARNVDDILWRRSKLGLSMSATEKLNVAVYLHTLQSDEASTQPLKPA